MTDPVRTESDQSDPLFDPGQTQVREVRKNAFSQVTGSDSGSDRSESPKPSPQPRPEGAGWTAGSDQPPTEAAPKYHLARWLATVRRRDVHLTVRNGIPELAGEDVTANDIEHASVFRFALNIAALGHAPAWWNYVAGKTTTPPQEHEEPLVGSHTDPAGQAYPCATCGAPAHRLDAHLLGWCPDHDE